MDRDFEEAFYEVDEILKNIPQKLIEKIPQSFRNTIKENKSTTYKKQINGLQDIKNLKKETRVILYYIYRDFLSSEEECKKMKQEEIKTAEEKYSYENLFVNKEKEENKNDFIERDIPEEKLYATCESSKLIEYKEPKLYMKIISFIKNIINTKM